MSIQPFKGDDMIIIERRHADGTLDLRGEPQPPTKRRRCGHDEAPGVMRFNEVYDLYFRETENAPDRGTSASYEELEAWLKAKCWSLRAKTW